MRKVIQIMLSVSNVARAQPSPDPAEPQNDCSVSEKSSLNLCSIIEDYWNARVWLRIFGIPMDVTD